MAYDSRYMVNQTSLTAYLTTNVLGYNYSIYTIIENIKDNAEMFIGLGEGGKYGNEGPTHRVAKGNAGYEAAVIINGIPLANSNGERNYKEVDLQWYKGNEKDSYLSPTAGYFGSPVTVGVDVRSFRAGQSWSSIAGDPVVFYTTNNPKADALQIRIRIGYAQFIYNKEGGLSGQQFRFFMQYKSNKDESPYAWKNFLKKEQAIDPAYSFNTIGNAIGKEGGGAMGSLGSIQYYPLARQGQAKELPKEHIKLIKSPLTESDMTDDNVLPNNHYWSNKENIPRIGYFVGQRNIWSNNHFNSKYQRQRVPGDIILDTVRDKFGKITDIKNIRLVCLTPVMHG